MIIEELELNQGKILIQKYISDDIKIIFNLLKKIVNISKEGKDLLSSGFDGAVRALNIPEYISEALFCLTLNPDRYVRFLKKFNGSIEKTDIFDLKEEKGIELKTKNSKEPSPSSFSPKEIKTACYVMDTSNIFTEGNSIVKIAEIDILKLENYKINTTSTFREQRINGRRPRLIIKIRTMNEIIEQDILILDSVREVIIE